MLTDAAKLDLYRGRHLYDDTIREVAVNPLDMPTFDELTDDQRRACVELAMLKQLTLEQS